MSTEPRSHFENVRLHPHASVLPPSATKKWPAGFIKDHKAEEEMIEKNSACLFQRKIASRMTPHRPGG